MKNYIGLDIGGTKIAAAVFTEEGERLSENVVPTPAHYDAFLTLCAQQVRRMEAQAKGACTVGISMCGAINHKTETAVVENIPYLNGKPIREDLQKAIGRDIRLGNDMNCAALAEAIDGAAQGYESVVGITLSTGVGSGYIVRHHIVDGPNGLTGEFGHLPMPFRQEGDSPPFPCVCKQSTCIEKAICGGGLMRLYQAMTGQQADPPTIGQLAFAKDPDALRVMDRYYDMVAKSMIVLLYTFDPDAIVVSGGLSQLPDLFDEVPKRWGKYALVKEVQTKFLRAAHGPHAGVRGAAWLWRE